MAVAYRIYARALFDAAQNHDRLARVREDLADFVAAVEQVPELRALLRDPVLDPKEKAAALDSILGGVDELVRNFLLLVAEKNRTAADRGDRPRVRPSRRGRRAPARGRADDRVRALRQGGEVDRRPDREGVRPPGRRDALGRSRPDRRPDPAGGLDASRRERPRKIEPTAPRPSDKELI